MKKLWKVMLTFLLVAAMTAGIAACGEREEGTTTEAEGTTTAEGTTVDEGDPDYNVEEDLVEGVLTEDMLDEMEEEEATTEEEKKEETEKDKTANLKKYYIKVNRQTNVVTVYTYDEDGNYTKPVKAFVCSTGKSNGTPTGKFTLSSKHRWQLMNGGVYSQYASRITGHILFHSVPYYEMANDTLCTGYYNQLGRQASAGCVRLTCADAKWIYSNCASGTVVEIFDGTSANDPLGKPGSIHISKSSPYKGWDPTDPDSDNPWKNAKPTISGAQSRTVELGSGNVDLTSGVTATDAYGVSLKVSVSGNVDTSKLGTYSVSYSATDSRGNSTKTTITITVKDTTGPSISCSVDGGKYTGERNADAVAKYVKANTTAKDTSGTGRISKVTVSSIDEENGKITGTITATDDSGNTSTKSFTLIFEVDKSTEDEESSSTEEITETEPTDPTEETTETEPSTEEKPTTEEVQP